MIDVHYILALEQNVRSFLKNNNVTMKHWLNPRLIILVQLYEQYPKHIRQSKFIDVLHDKQTISRATSHLVEMDFIKISKCKTKGQKANNLKITDQGRKFIEWIDPDNEDEII